MRLREKGFSLAELVLALGIISVSVLAALGVAIYSSRGNGKAESHFRASQKAESVMADVESVLAADLDADVTASRQPMGTLYNPEGAPAFEYEVSQSFVGAPADRLKEVVVTVFWEDQQGDRSFRCTTRVTD